MPITQAQLSAKIKAAMELNSDNPDVNIEEARQHLADEIAAGVAEFTIGRLTTGTASNGASVTTTIQV
ncbi:hypothetical protein BN863_28530 [Formosa agariphila KMM 3901]|uniref:Uncharacterized protein n=1 Tax=Formosa agariphila (strain DSM 15362 / KCTC 12365 / LMG 23005 / KMM 3901 / M-2Alg 35-1) TaxID=1347342 RepID=T2KP82_FORAG|nr:hypothetical protein [Formosa agariphila]CDF80565.1 hypothetical protein BN863_28530 [Formosa agariphila KMM 3901]